MKDRIACYCSGNASRIIKFYEKYEFASFPMEFVFYDGDNLDVVLRINEIDDKLKVIHFENKTKLKGKKLSQEVSDVILKNLEKFKISYMFCFGSMILKSPLINKFENRIINFHPSLLPAFPGLRAIDQALEYGVKYLGNTAHFIDEGIDTGKIISQTVLPIEEFNDYEDVLSLQINMLKNIFIAILNRTIPKYKYQ